MVEDVETLSVAPGTGEPYDRVSATMTAMRDGAAAAGVKLRLGPSLARRLRTCGLDRVDCEGRLRMCRGNSPSARLARLNFEQLREPLLASGQLTIEQFDEDVARLDDDEYRVALGDPVDGVGTAAGGTLVMSSPSALRPCLAICGSVLTFALLIGASRLSRHCDAHGVDRLGRLA